jgi:hypothetical protein
MLRERNISGPRYQRVVLRKPVSIAFAVAIGLRNAALPYNFDVWYSDPKNSQAPAQKDKVSLACTPNRRVKNQEAASNRGLFALIAASILRFALSAEVIDDRLQVRCIRASIMVEVVPA